METVPSALEELKRLEDTCKTTILSPKLVSERLQAIAANSFAERLCLRFRCGEQQFLWGDVDSTSSLTQITEYKVAADAKCEVLAKRHGANPDELELSTALGKFGSTLWRGDLRKKGALVFENDAVKAQICVALRSLARGNEVRLWVAYIDLDHFKALNTHIGHEKADRVIEKLNWGLHEVARNFGGLVFNRSGDEFYVFLPYGGMMPMLEALHSVRVSINSEVIRSPDGKEHRADISIGVIETRDYSTLAEVTSATSLAEDQTKDASNNNEKRRARITIARGPAISYLTCTAEQMMTVGTVILRRRLSRQPFEDPNLAFISHQVAAEMLKRRPRLTVRVQSVVAWLGLSITDKCWEAILLESTSSDQVPRLAVALCVAHGVARAALTVTTAKSAVPAVSISFSRNGKRAAVHRNGKVVWGAANASDPRMHVLKPSTATGGDSCVVGVQFGLLNYARTPSGARLPADLFDQTVVVDERPVAGGSLPDFWQPAIAEIYSTLGRNGGVPHVIVWGKGARETLTYDKLVNSHSADVDEIAKVAGLTSSEVGRLSKAMATATRLIVKDATLLNAIFDLIGPSLNPSQVPSSTAATSSLQRSLTRPMLSRDPLPLAAGVRCRTAAEAYPLIIDLLRKGVDVLDSNDDANGKLKELRAFKLILDDPLNEQIPGYLGAQKASLAEYADRSMLDKKKGLFRKELEAGHQVSAFVDHLAGYLAAPEPARSTRRACLVVPNQVVNGEPRPLGLISVWASPRVATARHVIDFVFVWRTVEAFVGLPYSLYGSIRLAEDLVQILKGKVSQVPNGRAPEVGELTYIPMSLHMRVGDFHDRIAKRIVDESSD